MGPDPSGVMLSFNKDILQFLRAATSAAVNTPNSDLTSFKIPQALRNFPYLLLRNKKVAPLHPKISKIQ